MDTDDVPRTEAFLTLAGAAAISLAGGDDEELLEPQPGTTPLWRCVSVRALFPPGVALDSVSASLHGTLGGQAGISFHALPDAGWNDALRSRPNARLIGKRLRLAATDEEITDRDRAIVRLNFGLAFGTGEHPTTALCLEWLDGELRPGTTVLDYGCGSGILALSALQLGAAAGWAVDQDAQALRATTDNARLNRLEDRLWIGLPDALPAVKVDVIVANILSATLENLASLFERCAKPGGHVVLSGILATQSEGLRQAYREAFGPFTVRERDRWVLLTATRH